MRMKKGPFSVCLFTVLVLCGVMFCFGAEEETGTTASVSFPEPVYTFDAVFEGLSVPHDFLIQNKGTGVLDVQRVEGG
jgi:hypothetical protein